MIKTTSKFYITDILLYKTRIFKFTSILSHIKPYIQTFIIEHSHPAFEHVIFAPITA